MDLHTCFTELSSQCKKIVPPSPPITNWKIYLHRYFRRIGYVLIIFVIRQSFCPVFFSGSRQANPWYPLNIFSTSCFFSRCVGRLVVLKQKYITFGAFAMWTDKYSFMQTKIDTIFMLILVARLKHKTRTWKVKSTIFFILPHWTASISTRTNCMTVQN